MTRISFLVLTACISIHVGVQAKQPSGREVGEAVGDVYAYYTTQTLLLERIKKAYPEHLERATKAQSAFDAYFKPLLRKVDLIGNSFGKEKWLKMKKQVDREMGSLVQSVPLDPKKGDSSLKIIKQIEEESKGKLPPNILDSIQSVKRYQVY